VWLPAQKSLNLWVILSFLRIFLNNGMRRLQSAVISSCMILDENGCLQGKAELPAIRG